MVVSGHTLRQLQREEHAAVLHPALAAFLHPLAEHLTALNGQLKEQVTVPLQPQGLLPSVAEAAADTGGTTVRYEAEA